MNIHLTITDKNKKVTPGNEDKQIIKIDRKLKGENKMEGLILTPQGTKKEHNILLYVENLKTKVNGYVEYVHIFPDNN